MSRGAQIKKEDLELFYFYFSDYNLNSKAVSNRLKNILKLRFIERMTYAQIGKEIGLSELKVRTEIRLFKRKATIAKWYSAKKKENENAKYS